MTHILMVCWGNICRSPTLEVVCRQRAGQGFVFDSCGISAEHTGETADLRSRQYSAIRGYDLSQHRAKGIAAVDVKDFSIIAVMEKVHLQRLRSQLPPEVGDRLRLVMQLAGSPDEEVLDPYYGTAAGFERVLDQAERVAEALARA